MIKLQIVGNLGADCIQKEVNGKTVINFNVAHTEKFKDAQGNLKERTTWVNCAYWTDRTAVAQYLKKGKQVYVEGTPEAEAYTNKENQPAATLRMRVRDLQLLGGNIDGSQGNPNQFLIAYDLPQLPALLLFFLILYCGIVHFPFVQPMFYQIANVGNTCLTTCTLIQGLHYILCIRHSQKPYSFQYRLQFLFLIHH